MSAEDLRVLIGQAIGLQFLVPVAVGILEQDPFTAGDYYPGDLLVNVLRLSPTFWAEHRDLRSRVEKVLGGIDIHRQDLTPTITQELEATLREGGWQTS